MERLIETEQDRLLFIRFLGRQEFPFVVTLKSGRSRSYDQNRLQFMWAAEVAAQSGDTTAREVQIEWKARFAAPILLTEDEKFADLWVRMDRCLTHEEKLAWLEWIPVTSLLTMKGFADYLNEILRYYTERGIKLTVPEDIRWGDAKSSSRVDRRHTGHGDTAAGKAKDRASTKGKVS